jgi:hypothetical protein
MKLLVSTGTDLEKNDAPTNLKAKAKKLKCKVPE